MHMEDARATSEVVEVEARAMQQGLARQPTVTTSDLEADVVAHVENRDPRGVEMSQALVAVTENPVAVEPVARSVPTQLHSWSTSVRVEDVAPTTCNAWQSWVG